MQKKIKGLYSASSLVDVIMEECFRNPLVVAGRNSFEKMPTRGLLDNNKIQYFRFSEYSSNPKYDEVLLGVQKYRENNCDAIIAVGGGSAIDVAKCIRHFVDMDIDRDCLQQEYKPTKHIKLIAIPTTAGTGSESTHFAVVYKDGIKYSVAHAQLRPDVVILDGALLESVPDYHKKAAYMDALSQAIESWWAKKADQESVGYSEKAIKTLLSCRQLYMAGEERAAQRVLEAANYAGEAINITTTTAAHAMSYKLTSLYGIAHGHAVALCLPAVWQEIANKVDSFHPAIKDISRAFFKGNHIEAINEYRKIMTEFEFGVPVVSNDDIKILAESVNVQRLSNNPVSFSEKDLYNLYRNILFCVEKRQ